MKQLVSGSRVSVSLVQKKYRAEKIQLMSGQDEQTNYHPQGSHRTQVATCQSSLCIDKLVAVVPQHLGSRNLGNGRLCRTCSVYVQQGNRNLKFQAECEEFFCAFCSLLYKQKRALSCIHLMISCFKPCNMLPKRPYQTCCHLLLRAKKWKLTSDTKINK